jgi:cupin fold WbuC family metalloprotein
MYKLINDQLCNALNHTAKAAARKRTHHNFHPDLSDPVQRLCIAMAPGTYIRPHRHPENYKWEMILAISGEIRMMIFDDQGRLKDILQLAVQGPIKGVEIPPNTWHMYIPVSEQAIMLEIKQGPYVPTTAEHFAGWAPEENSPEVDSFLRWCGTAKPGDQYRN